jgi:hypothetical protein
MTNADARLIITKDVPRNNFFHLVRASSRNKGLAFRQRSIGFVCLVGGWSIMSSDSK